MAGPRAYPWILAVDVDGLSRPITERDFSYATALLEALAVFLHEHAGIFEEEPASPIGRNPKTGEAVALAGKNVPHFKPGKDLRERVNDGADQPIRD